MPHPIYRFAGFELDPVSGELRSGDSRSTLQEKPLLLLKTLLDNPQQIVTREKLRAAMWNVQTVVEFDQGINAAIKKVRDALADPVLSPRIIETVAKKGYRLMVPVTIELKADPPASRTGPELSSRMRRLRWAIPLALVVGTSWFYLGWVASPPHTEIRSLAVLPLQDLSPTGAHEYFADGVTEEITTNLAQTLSMRVISRTSVMRYKRTTKPIRQIARELGVEAIVEGSVARAGERVTVTVQLIDAVGDRHLWAEKYNRRADDILAIEAELAQAIASQITGTLDRQRPARRVVRRVDPRVHELCLLGRYHVNRRTTADLDKAKQFFEQAIALDPDHAPAHAGLADVHALQPFIGAAKFGENSLKAEAEARRALELDPALAEAHATLGLLRITSRDWPESAVNFRRALELNPNYATAHHWYSYYLRFANRLDEACAEIEAARLLDPLSAAINADVGEMFNAARRYDEARERLRQAIELAPEFGRSHALLAVTEMASGHAVQAVEHARDALAREPAAPFTLAQAGFALASAGYTDEAVPLLEKLQAKSATDVNISMYVAVVQAGLGRKEEALATLERQSRSPDSVVLQGIQHWYAFEALRDEPRFRKLLSPAW